MKKKIKQLLFIIRFSLSSRFTGIYGRYYSLFYRPKAGSLSAYLDSYSKYRKGRVRFIQIGANDGITHDPIHKFIRRDAWSGLLLEPQKYVFDRFLVPLYARTEGIIPINAAIGSEDGVLPIFQISYTNERWATGLTSFDKQTLQKMIDNGYVARQSLRSGIQAPEDRSQWISEDMVEVICFRTLAQKYPQAEVNLVMIDAEGFDDQIIRMIDFDVMRPDVIVFESMHLDDTRHQSICTFLEQYNYRVSQIDASSIALQKKLPLR